MKYIRQAIVYMMIIVMPFGAILGSAQAAVITTDQVANAATRDGLTQKVRDAMNRPELARQLEVMGVAPEQARARVDALSDQELASLSGEIDKLPAGGDFIGTVGAIFIILLITDILGFTKIFPFTKAQR